MTILNSTISDNTVVFAANPPEERGGGIYNGLGGTLTISNSTLMNNGASAGGGIFIGGGFVTLTNSTLSNNVGRGGGINNDSALTISDTTFSGNRTNSSWGGAIHNSGTVTLTNSTFSNNSASFGNGGAIYNGPGSTVMLTNSTLSGNSALAGGGIYTDNLSSTYLINSIIANSLNGNDCSFLNIQGIHASGTNLIEDGSCGVAGVIAGDPLLGALTGNPAYFPLLPGSPAMDVGDDCLCPVTDQRGVSRPLDGNGDGTANCDIGSFEADGAPASAPPICPAPPTATPTSTDSPTDTSTPTIPPTETPTATATGSPAATETPTMTSTPSETPIFTSTPTQTPTPVVILPTATVPPPPPTPLCEDHNFAPSGVVRASTRDGLDYAINCRVLYQNGQPTQWLGGNLYNAGSIGIEGIFDLGVLQAVDIFSPVGRTYFEGGAVFCLRGQGTLIWLAARGVPRHAEIIGSYDVDDFPGFTCATLFEPGTLVLVRENPMQ